MSFIKEWLDKNQDTLIDTAKRIHENPEIAYQEKVSSKILADMIAGYGFDIEFGTAGIETAFTAVWSSADCGGDSSEKAYRIGFLAEYDALAGIGHACGHNLLGTAVGAAACALKAEYEARMEAEEVLPILEIIVFGCPAEEIMSGKIVMDKAGVFDDLDFAVTWHPFDRNRISNDIWQAQDIKTYTFHGVSAHASRAPEMGRSALDACELMNVGVNYLREHVPDEVRMHYRYLDNGIPANVVPDTASLYYFVRSASRAITDDASRRVDLCAKGAAMMTETTVDITLEKSCKETKLNKVLNEVFYEAMTETEVPKYNEEELQLAEQITEECGFENGGVYFTGLEPLEADPVKIAIGTDASQVSHTVPMVMISAQTMCKGTPLHHKATALQSGMSIGFKGMMYAAEAMARGSMKMLEKPELIEAAWAEHRG